jgi:hypothetical protein
MKHHHYLLRTKNLHAGRLVLNLNNFPNTNGVPLYCSNVLEYFYHSFPGHNTKHFFSTNKVVGLIKFYFYTRCLCIYIYENDYYFIAKIDGRGNARHYGLVILKIAQTNVCSHFKV